MNPSGKGILIDLSHSSDARVLSVDQQLQQRAWECVLNLLSAFVSRAKKQKQAESAARPCDELPVAYLRSHNNILIHGERGTGKTSFLLSLLQGIDERKLGPVISPNNAECLAEICVLGHFDPTMIETHENIFISVIALIKRKVNRFYQQDKLKDETAYLAWQKHLQVLARGLCQLKGVGQSNLQRDGWDDHNYILQEGMDDFESGMLLERRFSNWVDISLELLNQTAFLIGFDDVDTQFERGWQVLEVLRKFITSPRLIVVLSGDIELYATLVRKNQYQMLAPLHNLHDKNREDQYHKLVDNLEEQYLLKLLKPENRINLVYFDELLEAAKRSKHTIRISFSQNELGRGEHPTDIDVILKKLCSYLFLRHNTRVQALYRQLVTEVPMRTMVQFLKLYEMMGPSDGASEDRENDTWPALERLAGIYNSSLLQHGLRQQDIAALQRPGAGHELITFLEKNKVLANGIRLTPVFQEALNRALMVVGSVYSWHIHNNPAAWFDYCLRCMVSTLKEKNSHLKRLIPTSAAKTIAGFVVYQTREKADKPKMLKQGTIRTISDSRRRKNSRDTFDYYFDFEDIHEIPDYYSKFDIFLFWRQTIPKGKGDSVFKTHFNTRETLTEAIKSDHRYFIAPLFTQVSNDGQGSRLYASIYSLLGFMADILSCKSEREIEQLIFNFQKVQDIGISQIENKGDEEDEDDENEEDQDKNASAESTQDQLTDASPMVKSLFQWREKWDTTIKNTHPLHINTFAAIWERFETGIGRLDKDVKKKHRFLGSILHRLIVLFLYAVTVELRLLFNHRDGLNLSNPTGSDDLFLRQLDFLKKEKDKNDNTKNNEYHLFYFLWACPLWGLFLKPKTTNTNNSATGDRTQIYSAYLKHQKVYFNETQNENQFRVEYFYSYNNFENLFLPLCSIPLFQKHNKVILNLTKARTSRTFRPPLIDELPFTKYYVKRIFEKHEDEILNLIPEDLKQKDSEPLKWKTAKTCLNDYLSSLYVFTNSQGIENRRGWQEIADLINKKLSEGRAAGPVVS